MMPKIPATSIRSVVCTNPLARLLLASAFAGGASALTGCGVGSSSGQTAAPAASEPVSTTRSALTQPTTFTWSQGQGALKLLPWNDYFCYLTGISGRFRGQGESVHLTNDDAGNWSLTGSSGQVGVSATAMCVPWSAFSHPDWGFGIDQYVHNDQQCAQTCGFDFTTCPFRDCASAQLQGSTSFCSLSGVAGRLMFGGNFDLGGGPTGCNGQSSTNGDIALVQWAPPGTDLSFFTNVSNAYAQTTSPYPCNVDGWQPTISDWAECMNFNNSPALNVSTYYTALNGASVDMGPMTDEFCALAGVTGRFDGSGESASISLGLNGQPCLNPGSGTCHWILSASDSKVGATAACVYYPSLNGREIGVFRRSTGEWYLAHNNKTTLVSDNVTGPWGLPDDLPVAGDWDGDGREGVGVFRPSTGQWFFSNSVNPVGTSIGPTQSWGLPGDMPVAGDWDGNGTVTIGLFRPATGEWFFSNSITNPETDIYSGGRWGLPGDMPVAGDWDGDGRYGVGVFRPSTGQWFFSNSLSPASTAIGPTNAWGLPGDMPIAGDWFGNGKPTIGVFRPSVGQWFFSNELAAPQTDLFLAGPWGSPGDYPVGAVSDRSGWVSRWQM